MNQTVLPLKTITWILVSIYEFSAECAQFMSNMAKYLNEIKQHCHIMDISNLSDMVVYGLWCAPFYHLHVWIQLRVILHNSAC